MASILAIVSKAVFNKEARGLGLGDVYPTSLYRSQNRGLAGLAEGGDLYLATVRPGDVLWLVAVLKSPEQTDNGWQAAANARPIEDISALMPRFVFTTGKGIAAAPGKLGMSLQTPRTLLEGDVALLQASPAAAQTQPKTETAKTEQTIGAQSAPEPSKPLGADLDALLESWRATKAPEIAELIAELGQACESKTAKALRKRDKIAQKEWLALAAALTTMDRGALLCSLINATASRVAERIEHLGSWGADPRIADALHEMIRRIPWTSTGSRKVWTRAFKLLETLGDPRTIDVCEAFDPKSIASSWEGPGQWMQERLTKLATLVRAVPSLPLSDEQKDALAKQRARLPSKIVDRQSASLDEQLGYVLSHPEDDDAKLVLADLLQEIDDPRGELITLQFLSEQQKLTREQKNREKQILKDHYQKLLGPLAQNVLKRSVRFRRGFVVACELKENVHQNQLEALAQSELLGSIETLHQVPIALLQSPHLHSLKDVAIKDFEPLALLLWQNDRRFGFKALQIWVRDDGDIALLAHTRTLPQLEKLTLCGRDEWIAQAAYTELAKHVRWLHLSRFDVDEFREHIEPILLAKDSQVTEISSGWGDVSYEGWHFDLKISRDHNADSKKPRYAVSVTLQLPSASWRGALNSGLHQLGRSLSSLKGLALSRVEVDFAKPLRDKAVRAELLGRLHHSVADSSLIELAE
jgi:uncharacterized protein (TIGR02996 family)